MTYDLTARLMHTERLQCPLIKKAHEGVAYTAELDAAREELREAQFDYGRASAARDAAWTVMETANARIAKAKTAIEAFKAKETLIEALEGADNG